MHLIWFLFTFEGKKNEVDWIAQAEKLDTIFGIHTSDGL